MTKPQIETLDRYLPAWTRQLKETYASGTSQMFVVHGNVGDFVRLERPEGLSYVMLPELLSTQVFGTFDAVLYFDIARGPRALASSPARLEKINQLIERFIGPVEQLRGLRSPAAVMAVLDKFLDLALLRDADRPSVAIVLDYAHFLAPASAGGAISADSAAVLATLQNWARSPYFKRAAFAFVLISERLSDLEDSLAHSAHTTRLEIPFPDESERRRYVEWSLAGRDHGSLSDFGPSELATLTGGLSLVNLAGLLQSAIRTGQRLDATRLKAFKKQMIEGQCQGLVELVEPRHTLDLVVGQEAAVARLKQDAQLLLQGRLDAVPMGYLLTGSVGTGKTFLAECYAGSVGIPCVKLLNFRSKYVGETEGNLEKILKILRVMGPVAVIIDEADAMLGNRGAGGDSGTSGRVFGQFATQMGNTQYRGR
ncbi:MAG: ATP-binding protein, partial [Myxococcota bacterium]|nr:ATP-binding protein [Myxococcota bacterium]